jgi:ParB-like chromosome segregation protein Spo0J
MAAMKYETVKVADLSNDPANARKHGEKNIATIVASLRRFGQQKPIVVDSSGVVRAGNGTLEAAKQLGWDTIEIQRTELTSSDAIAYAIADNRTSELAEWDDDILAAQLQGLLTEDEELLDAAGFDEDELAELLGGDGNDDEEIERSGAIEKALQLVPDREYAVIMCESDDEWEEMRTTLKLQSVRRGGYKKGSAFDSVGTQRVLKWSDLRTRIADDLCDTV